jgi:hypothetical protein
MNLNYVGSVAERFMKFRSTLATEENVSENLFNALSIYVPKSLASANINSEALDPTTVTADNYAVIAVTVDNYKTVLSDTGSLLSQWLPVFNDGTNSSITIYLIVFDDTEFAPTVADKAIVWSPLKKAFDDLYFISCFKVMFDTDYTSLTDNEGTLTVNNYADLALCLSYLCSTESTLSMCLTEIKVTVPETKTSTDENAVKILSQSRGDETTYCTTLTGSTQETRAQYLWGYINLTGGAHTWVIVHNGNYMLPIVLGKWFTETNDSGEFVGNKLAKIRLSGSKVKPTGNPSPLNSDVNLNLDPAWYTNLDDKNVGYFLSISGSSYNNAELLKDRTVEGFPVTAYIMSKWVDYNTSQQIADFSAESSTLTKPRLCNSETYESIHDILRNNLTKITQMANRVTNVQMKFPPFEVAKKGNGFEGTAVWSATYVDDFDHVDFSGTINF